MDAESDDTAASPELDLTESASRADETVVVPRKETQPELAWSIDGPDYTQQWVPGGMPPDQSSSRRAWVVYTAIGAAAAAFVGVVAFWWGQHERTQVAPATTPPMAKPTASPTATAPLTAAAPHSPTTAPTAAPVPLYALPACYWQSDPPTERPTRVTFQTCADGGQRLESMSWSSWGATGAQGTGILSYQVCEPSCAEGHREQYAVNVSAFEPRPAAYNSGCPTDMMFYSEMILSFPASAPNSIEMAADTTYLGRPAIRFTTSPGGSARGFIGAVICM
jgi:serine/threonine-protein kinase